MQSASDPNANTMSVGYYLWLAAIGAIVYAYVFATNRSDMKNTTLDSTKIDEATGKPTINTGNRVITLLPLMWLYAFLTKIFTAFSFEYLGDYRFTIVNTILTLLTLVGISIVATQTNDPTIDTNIEGSNRSGYFTANVVFIGIICLFPILSLLLSIRQGGGMTNIFSIFSGLISKASQFVFSFWFPFMMMVYFIKTGATYWFRIVAVVSTVLAIIFNLYNLHSIYNPIAPLKDWLNTAKESIKYFLETSPILSYLKFVETNDLTDVAKQVLVFALLCYVAYLMISVYKFKNTLSPCISTHFASCFWNPNFKQSDGKKTYYDPEKNTPYINALFYTLMMSVGVNILNYIMKMVSLYKRYNNLFNGANDIISEPTSWGSSILTLFQMIIFPFYWTFKLFVQHPIITIVAFIVFAAIGLLLYRSSFDLTAFIEGQRGTVITLFTLFIASLIMFGVYTANNKDIILPSGTGSGTGSGAGSSESGPSYLEFIMRPMIFIAVAACIIGIISYFLTSHSRLITMATLLQYAITMLIYITGIAIVIGLVRTMFSMSRKMGDTMFQTSEDSNWVINVLKLMGNALFYLPCMMLDFADTLKEQYGLTTRPYLILLAVEAVFILAGMYLPSLVTRAINHTGVQIVSAPISITSTTTLSQYTVKFVDSKEVVSHASGAKPSNTASPDTAKSPMDIQLHNYSYGVSAWFYIHPQPPNAYVENQALNVFKFGNDGSIGPTVSYIPKTNTLTIEMHGSSGTIPPVTDVLLQRWNNIVVNSDKGAIDIFINGRLVYTGTHIQSANTEMHRVVIGNNNPNDTNDETHGVQGEICNMVLNRKPFTNAEIAWFYKTNKMLNPPVVSVNPDPHNQGDSASYLASNPANVDDENNVDKSNPLSFSTYGARTYGLLGAFLGAILGWFFNRDDGVEPVKGLLMGTVVFGLIGAMLGALFSTDGTVATIMKTVANVFANTF